MALETHETIIKEKELFCFVSFLGGGGLWWGGLLLTTKTEDETAEGNIWKV